MKPVSSNLYYRAPSDTRAAREDAGVLNNAAGIFLVADGLSDAYSPDHPPLKYRGGLTGGQIASQHLTSACMSGVGLASSILAANAAILSEHEQMGRSPLRGDDVGGASFAGCQVNEDGSVDLIFAGDCFAVVKQESGLYFFTGFDAAAKKTEEEAVGALSACFAQAGGDKAAGWNLYRPILAARKVRCSNKLIGQGGYAYANGDPALEQCWSVHKVEAGTGVEWILLGTDGMVPSTAQDEASLKASLGERYTYGGLPAVLEWRDAIEFQAHIGRGKHPEATAVEIKF